MKNSQPVGLNELMIVNPGPPGFRSFFLGEDGTLYQVQGLGQEEELRGVGQFFLGEDGILYQVPSLGLKGSSAPAEISADGVSEDKDRELGRYFLGEDGTLYEVVR